ncbi:hypothetical protein E5H08_23180 [Escherichia coli]|nr:hypothetical protein [Escherichia coli]HBA7220868.1 tail fiber assembly protein [Escherichia coli]HBV8399290.1 hypothetical protein [Escherichia coli]HCO0301710.1 hypothetical protein [Escherichia coli]HDI6285751.1 hypothetical protein [Escherichia coli]
MLLNRVDTSVAPDIE